MEKFVLSLFLAVCSMSVLADTFIFNHEVTGKDIDYMTGFYKYDANLGVEVVSDDVCRVELGDDHITDVSLLLIKLDGTQEEVKLDTNRFEPMSAHIYEAQGSDVTVYESLIVGYLEDNAIFIMEHTLLRPAGINCATMLPGEYRNVDFNIRIIGDNYSGEINKGTAVRVDISAN